MQTADELLSASGLDKPERWDAADEATKLAWLDTKDIRPDPEPAREPEDLETRLRRLERADDEAQAKANAPAEVNVRGRGSVRVDALARCPVGVVGHECGLNAPNPGGRLTSDLEGNPDGHCWRCGFGSLTDQQFTPTYKVHPTLGLVVDADEAPATL